jgi:hypothetical protein
VRPESGRPLTVLWALVGAEKAMSSSQEARACSLEWPREGADGGWKADGVGKNHDLRQT